MKTKPAERRQGERRSGDSVDIRGPFGINIKAKGREVVLVVLILAIVGLLALGGYLHHQEMVTNDQKQDLRSIQAAQQIDALIYVLSLPQEKREALNLSMPESLRQRVRRSRSERNEP